jgi:hypothetical protein
MTPDEARELLNLATANNDVDHALEKAYVETRLLLATMKGDHAAELAKLHAQTVGAETAGEDATPTRERREQIIDAIIDEILEDLEVHGLPEAWRPQP